MVYREAVSLYIEHLEKVRRSEETIKTYGKILNLFYVYLSAKKNYQVYVEDIIAEDIESYMAEKCNGENYSSSYRANTINTIKGMLLFCYMKGYCKRNISKQVDSIKKKVKEKVRLMPEEVEILFSNIGVPTIKIVVQTLYYAGLRINECINLKSEDVDFERNCIIVRCDKSKNTRIIPINYKLRAILSDYIKWRNTTNEKGYFFATRTGTISPNYVNKEIKEAAKRAGLRKKITCHTMRHSCASNLAENGADLNKIKIILGHKSLRMTKIYLHSSINELRQAVKLIN